MDHVPSRNVLRWVVVALAAWSGPDAVACRGQGDPSIPGLRRVEAKSQSSARPRGPWRAHGRVTDAEGRPLAGVEVRANCGAGTLRRTGLATTDADGRYELLFGPGISSGDRDDPSLQAATIFAHLPGYFEVNLCRQGGCRAALREPNPKELESWGTKSDRLFLPGSPLQIDFVMRPSGRLSGRLVDERGKPLPGYSVSLHGAELPPSSSVMAWVQADADGRFTIEDIPTTFRFQLVVRKANPTPPWDDSWSGAALRFERPDQGGFRAWFGRREILVRDFTLRIAGPGMHDRSAVPIAGNVGMLDLAANGPADVLERRDVRLVLGSATLTLRNSTRPDGSRSLVTESVATPPRDSPTKLTRTRPNPAGEFIVSFENPRGFRLEPGKHQVIFQVFVGVSQKPLREKIFRQIDARREGRYEVPVKVNPEWLDDSRVSITFVTVQPEHDAWVRAFFVEGKGTSYKGIWTGDGGILPAIPLAAAPSR